MILSNRQKKMGNRIMDAAMKLFREKRAETLPPALTAGEVAREAGVSTPTARKYLRMAKEMGIVSEYFVYAPTSLWFIEGGAE